MLEIAREARPRLHKAFKYAREIGMIDQLKDQLRNLDTYAEHDERGRTRCVLWDDFAPHSFFFEMSVKDREGEFRHWFNGGLIFHGSHDGGGNGGAPTFSVNLTPQSGWRMHT